MERKLDIGSGGKAPDGYLSHDFRADTNPDIVCDARKFDEELIGSFDEVRASNILEHFSRFEVKAVFAHWVSLLRPGGVISIIVPDMMEISRQLVLGYIGAETFSYLVFGGNDYPGNSHHYGFTPDSLRGLFAENDLIEISVVPGQRFELKGPALYCPMIQGFARVRR